MMFEILLLVLAIPAGFWIAWLARDELVQGRKWFRILIIVSIIGIIGFWIYGFPYISFTMGFILIVSFISLAKSDDKKWVKRKL
jgi:hypothetical protein